MTDPLFYVADAVLLVQLVVPGALGLAFFTSSRLQALADKKAPSKKERRKERPIDDGPKKPALVPLKCESCGAPVPLEGESFPCPHCEATVKPPPDYVEALRERREADRILERAERVWRFSRWTSSPLCTVPARIGVVTWLALVVFAAAAAPEIWPGLIKLLAIILAILFALWGYFTAAWLADERAKLPRVPSRAELKCEAGSGACRTCGAPIRFEENRLTTVCPYCGSHEYRAALAEIDRKVATSQKAEAQQSLVDAIAVRDERRAELLLMLPFMAIAEAFYVVVFAAVAIGDMLGC